MKLGTLLRSTLKDKRSWQPTALTQTQCLTLRQHVVEIVNMFARLLDHSFHREVLCSQLQQFNVSNSYFHFLFSPLASSEGFLGCP